MGLAAAHVLGGEWGVLIPHTTLVLLWGFGGCDVFVKIFLADLHCELAANLAFFIKYH